MPKTSGPQDVTKGDPPQPEAVPSSDVEVLEADPFAGFTEDDFRREVFIAREAQRRLQAGVDMMEENRDHWMARAERAEAALAAFVQDAQAKLAEIRQPNGG